MIELTAEQAALMSREEALRVLATADGVPEKDRRMAQLMLSGPSVQAHEVQAPRSVTITAAVRGALEQMKFEGIRDEQVARADMLELGRGRG